MKLKRILQLSLISAPLAANTVAKDENIQAKKGQQIVNKINGPSSVARSGIEEDRYIPKKKIYYARAISPFLPSPLNNGFGRPVFFEKASNLKNINVKEIRNRSPTH